MNRPRTGCSRRWAAALLLALAAAPAQAARDVLLVLDNSGSMRRNDPARLAAPAVAEFIRSQPRDTRVGIVLFDTAPTLALKLMPAELAAEGDAAAALKRFDYRGRLTQTAGAVERALYELRSEGRPGAARAIVLVTDGLIDTGDKARDASLQQWLRTDLAGQAKADGVRLFGIAFTEQADFQLLQSLAATTGGEYFRVLDAEGIARALRRIDAVLEDSAAATAEAAPVAEAPGAAPAAQASPAVPPAAPQGAPRLEEDSGGGWLLLAVGLAALAGLLAWLWRRRGAPDGMARLLADRKINGPVGALFDSHERHELADRPVVIGRASGNDPSRYYIVLPEKTVGRWHATIERRGQTFWIRDEGSVNGTFVNGERLQGERPLKHRDSVRIHTHGFEFEIPELADADRTMLTSAEKLASS